MGPAAAAAANNHKSSLGFVQPLLPLPHFIKSFSIPKSFQAHLEAELTGHPLQSVVLITDSHPNPHRHWVVTIEDGRFFRNGWEDFCLHHCLRVGDFLVFTYHSHFLFNVTVLTLFLPVIVFLPLRHGIYNPQSKKMRVDCNKESEINDEDESESQSNDEEDEDEDERTGGIPSEKGYPSFMIRLTSYTIKRAIIHLPAGFVREQNLESRRCQVNIIDDKRKVWPMSMNYKKSSGQVYIMTGWKPFHNANRFKPDTFLCFQLLNDDASPTFKCYRASTLEIQSYIARKITRKQKGRAQVDDATTTSSSEEEEEDNEEEDQVHWYPS